MFKPRHTACVCLFSTQVAPLFDEATVVAAGARVGSSEKVMPRS